MSGEVTRGWANPPMWFAETSEMVLGEAGLSGWKAIIKAMDETTDFAAVITSPDFNPAAAPPAGRLFGGRGPTQGDALDAAIAKAKAATQ